MQNKEITEIFVAAEELARAVEEFFTLDLDDPEYMNEEDWTRIREIEDRMHRALKGYRFLVPGTEPSA